MTITLTALQKQRRDTAANWTSNNPTLLAGELGYESDTGKWKVGDGSTAWTGLAYIPGSQLSAYPIVNADIASGAEIDVAKLADGSARQLLQTDAAGTGVEWTDNVDVPGTLDVTGTGTFDGNVTIAGDLTVNGTTTTINTQDLLVEDKNIIIGNVTTPSDVTADGGGITLKGTTDKTINWVDATDAWTSSERFSVPLGSASAPSLTFTGDSNTGIYSPGADQLALSTNGTRRLFVDASGNVTVGSISGGQAFNVMRSAVNSLIRISDGTIDSYWGVSNAASAAIIDVASNTPFRIATNNTERLRITSAGLVGIGTSSPGAGLHIASAGQTTSALNTAGDLNTIISDTGGAVGNGGSLVFAANSGAWRFASIKGLITNGGNNTKGDLAFSTRQNLTDSTLTERLRITSAGNVGIGTTSPTQLLHVSGGNVVIQNASDQTPNANFDGHLKIQGNGYNAGITLDSAGMWVGTNSTSRSVILATDETERARIDGSGRLLVGTSSDSGGALLQVNGNRIRVATAKTPSSASDTGTAGEICWDASYIYVCTATNTWKRAALSTW